MTPKQLDEIKQLRSRQVAPKQIAKKLGLRPAEVKLAIQQQATAERQEQIARGDLPPLEFCVANGDMLNALFPKKGLLGKAFKQKLSDSMGLGGVVLVRNDRGRFICSHFLVDYFCLGVKDVIHRKFNSLEKARLLKESSLSLFQGEPQDISLEQAQAIVFGAIDYARELGFEPHRDFAKAQENLGRRPDSLPALEFGKDGQPFYFQGPHDNADKVIATLDKSVGRGNYHYTMMM